MNENIAWNKPGSDPEANQKIVEAAISTLPIQETNDDNLSQDRQIHEIIQGSDRGDKEESLDEFAYENAMMMHDSATKKYHDLMETGTEVVDQFNILTVNYEDLEKMSGRIEHLEYAINSEKKRFDLSKGGPLSSQEIDELKQQISNLKQTFEKNRDLYKQDLSAYREMLTTYQKLNDQYENLYAAWYPKSPELN